MRLVVYSVVFGFLFSWIIVQRSFAGIYSSRPDILRVDSVRHSNDPRWEKLKPLHIHLIAEVLEMYPDFDIYFLAREAESFYDLARVLLKREQDLQNLGRIHLLSVSEQVVNHPSNSHILEYLHQQGINRDTLKYGRKVLFVDFGSEGQISRKIQKLFPKGFYKNFRSHFVLSGNPLHPSTYSFLNSLVPTSWKLNSGTVRILLKEFQKRFYTSRPITEYQWFGNHWAPVYQDEGTSFENDASYSPVNAIFQMEDLKFFGESSEARDLFRGQREFWRQVKKLLDRGDAGGMQELLAQVRQDDPENGEALIRDLYSIVEKNFPAQTKDLPYLASLGLSQKKTLFSKTRFKVMSQFPEWKRYLEDDSAGTEELLKTENLKTLESIILEIDDSEFFKVLIENLVHQIQNETDAARFSHLIQRMIQKNDSAILRHLSHAFFSKPTLIALFKAELNHLTRAAIQMHRRGSFQLTDLTRIFEAANQVSGGDVFDNEVLSEIRSLFRGVQQSFGGGLASSVLELSGVVLSSTYAQSWNDEKKWVREGAKRLLDQPGDGFLLVGEHYISQSFAKDWSEELKILKERVRKETSELKLGSESYVALEKILFHHSYSSDWVEERIAFKKKVSDLFEIRFSPDHFRIEVIARILHHFRGPWEEERTRLQNQILEWTRNPEISSIERLAWVFRFITSDSSSGMEKGLSELRQWVLQESGKSTWAYIQLIGSYFYKPLFWSAEKNAIRKLIYEKLQQNDIEVFETCFQAIRVKKFPEDWNEELQIIQAKIQQVLSVGEVFDISAYWTILSFPGWEKEKELLRSRFRSIFERNSSASLTSQLRAIEAFSYSSALDWNEEIQLVFINGNPNVLEALRKELSDRLKDPQGLTLRQHKKVKAMMTVAQVQDSKSRDYFLSKVLNGTSVNKKKNIGAVPFLSYRQGEWSEYEDVIAKLSRFLAAGVPAREMMVILDVDDVLVVPPMRGFSKYRLREDVLSLVNFLDENSIPWVVSSAHKKFNETLSKLNDNDLFARVGLKSTTEVYAKSEIFAIGSRYYEAIFAGRVVSVKRKGESIFLAKAYAPCVLSRNDPAEHEKQKRLKYLFLVDDQAPYVNRFVEDLYKNGTSCYPALQYVEGFDFMKSEKKVGKISEDERF